MSRTIFRFLSAFLISCLGFQCKYSVHLLAREEIVAGFAEDPAKKVSAPLVNRTIPADSATAIGTNAKLHVSFNTAMAPSTLTVNTTDTACTGSILVSANNFVSCVRMSSVQAGMANSVFSVTPAVNLSANTRYKVRVAVAAQASTGAPLVEAYESTDGFTTASAADNRALVVQTSLASFVSPYDTATNVPLNTGVSVQFSEPVDPSMLTTNTGDTVCSGNIQLSQDLFLSCIRMRGVPAIATDGRIMTVFPDTTLSASTAYRIRITTGIRDLSGNPMASALTSNFTTGTLTESSAFAVLSTTPANAVTGISVSPLISIAFTAGRFIDATTVTLNSQGATCVGSIQVSADNFSTCVALMPVFIGSDFENVGVRVLAPLANATTYKIRVTSDLKDMFGVGITAFTTANGFTTTGTVTGGGGVSFLEPGDSSGASNDLYSAFTVSFTRVMNPATLTASTSGSACTGSFMVSADNFSTCLPMSAQPVASVGNTRFTVFPQSPLTASGVYRTRISTFAQDAGGAAVSLYNGAGITIMP